MGCSEANSMEEAELGPVSGQPSVSSSAQIIKADAVIDANEITPSQGVVSWSGGKDSMLALHEALAGKFKIRALLAMMDETGERSRSHAISPAILELQASSLAIPLKMAKAEWKNYESVIISELKQFSKDGVTHGIFGDIDIQPNREWEEKVCFEADLTPHLPLWGKARTSLTQSFINLGYRAIVVCVNGDFLDASFVGRQFDAQFLVDLPALIDPCGENGEFHTFVTAGPHFKYPLPVKVERIYSHEVKFQGKTTVYHYAQLGLQTN
jgi:uncharacterized protein (TIGR00290 family)